MLVRQSPFATKFVTLQHQCIGEPSIEFVSDATLPRGPERGGNGLGHYRRTGSRPANANDVAVQGRSVWLGYVSWRSVGAEPSLDLCLTCRMPASLRVTPNTHCWRKNGGN